MSKLFRFIIVLALALIMISNCSYVFAAVNMNLDDSTNFNNFDICKYLLYHGAMISKL